MDWALNWARQSFALMSRTAITHACSLRAVHSRGAMPLFDVELCLCPICGLIHGHACWPVMLTRAKLLSSAKGSFEVGCLLMLACSCRHTISTRV